MKHTLIRIDRNSIKPNPDAGKTHWDIPGVQSCTAHRDGCEFQSIGPVAVSRDGVRGTFVMTRSINVPLLMQEQELFFSARDSTVSVNQDMISFDTIHPDPDWLYEYEPKQVACHYCKETFDHTKLGSDVTDGGTYIENICPECGHDFCCNIKYEKIEDALKDVQSVGTDSV